MNGKGWWVLVGAPWAAACAGMSLTRLSPFAPRACLPPPAPLAAWWTGDGHARDLVGGPTGTLVGGAGYGPGLVGEAFRFNGTDSSVQIPDSERWDLGRSDFTLSLWARFTFVRPSTLSDPAAVLIGHDEGPGDVNKWSLALGGGFLFFFVDSPASGPHVLVQAPFRPEPGRWYALALLGKAGALTLAVDGAPVTTAAPSVAIPRARAPLTLGEAESGPGLLSMFFLDGGLDEVALFERALRAEEVRALYEAGSAGMCRVLPLTLRIRPGKPGSPLDLASPGLLPVAVLTTGLFDALRIDPTSIRLGDPAFVPRSGPVQSSFEDVDADGRSDLLLFFRIPDLVAQGAVGGATKELEVTGQTLDGVGLRGTAPVRVLASPPAP